MQYRFLASLVIVFSSLPAAAQTSATHNVTIIVPRFTSSVDSVATISHNGEERVTIATNKAPGKLIASSSRRLQSGRSLSVMENGNGHFSAVVREGRTALTGIGAGFFIPQTGPVIVTVTD